MVWQSLLSLDRCKAVPGDWLCGTAPVKKDLLVTGRERMGRGDVRRERAAGSGKKLLAIYNAPGFAVD